MADPFRATHLNEALRQLAEEYGQSPILHFYGEHGWGAPVTYRELERAAFGATHTLVEAGVGCGDRVLLALDTSLQAVAAFFAANQIGAIPVLTAPWPRGLGDADGFRRRLQATLARVRPKILVAHGALLPHLRELPLPLLADTALATEADRPARADHRSEICHLQLTSGSSGTPRAVRVTHAAALANASAIQDSDHLGPGDRLLHWVPLYHDMGLHGGLLQPLLARMPAWLMPPRVFLQRPQLWLEQIGHLGATVTVAPNFGYARMAGLMRGLADGAIDLSSLEHAYNGAEPIDAGETRAFLREGRRFGLSPRALAPCYGLGEATLAVTLTPRGEGVHFDRISISALRRHRAQAAAESAPETTEIVACGVPVSSCRVVIEDEAGNPVAEREVGEIVVAGASVCDGYFDPEEGAGPSAFVNGRIRTGDLGYFAAGRLYVVGRKKEVLIVRGEKFAPHELERVAESIAGIRKGRSACFAQRRAGDGSESVAIVCETRGAASEYPALARKVRGRLNEEFGLSVAVSMVPAGWVPTTSSGKLRRTAAREKLERESAAAQR